MKDDREFLLNTTREIESQAAILGEDVIRTTLSVLRGNLTRLDDAAGDGNLPHPEQRKQVTVLFATVSGAARLGDLLPDKKSLEILNILWRYLDTAITDQKGTIDKHLTNGVMGIFGVPVVREDDPERAIRAALGMQAAFEDFLAEMSASPEKDRPINTAELKTALTWDQLKLRIGINTGPVLLGAIGTGAEFTAIGSPVNIASRLEETAVNGGIIISHKTFTLVEPIFKVEPLGSIKIKGKDEPIQAYKVLGLLPRIEGFISRGVSGIRTKMVGRDGELSLLQDSLRNAAETGTGQVITVVGEAGLGKSRLINELQDWIDTMPVNALVFWGHSDQRMSHLPFALIRDMFSKQFGIQDNERTMVAESKLVRGMSEFMNPAEIDIHDRAHAIGQLIGLNLSTGFLGGNILEEQVIVRERVFDYISEFFEAVAQSHAVVTLILEDLHWADEGSISLIRRITQVCTENPLVIIGATRSIRDSLARLVPDEEEKGIPVAVNQEIIELTPLTKSDTIQLVRDILQKLPSIPDNLCQMIVARAEGNPFFVEELLKVLIEDDVIIPGEEVWQVQPVPPETVRIPPTLTGILQARLDRLSPLERATLQRAAVIGRIFWDRAVAEMGDEFNETILAETQAALKALERREMIFRRPTSSFSGTTAYYFKHAVLKDVTYESVLLRERPKYHRRAADWLSVQSGERVGEYAGLIGQHYELAGENVSAAELFEMAASRAEETFNPEAALECYQKSLSLLIGEQHHIAWQLQLQERVGNIQLRQAQLMDAEQTYLTMRYLAEQDGDLLAQARALNGMAFIYREQAEYEQMLQVSQQAGQMARLVGGDLELAQSLLAQSEAHLRLNNLTDALDLAEQAYVLSTRLNVNDEITLSLTLLCQVNSELGDGTEAARHLDMLQERVESVVPGPRGVKRLAFGQAALGRLYNQLGDFDAAASYLMAALKNYRSVDLRDQAAQVLNMLGETALLRGNPEVAAVLFMEALSAASEVKNKYGRLFYRMNFGAALIESGEFSRAELELRRVARAAKSFIKSGKWSGMPRVYMLLAQARLRQGGIREAMVLAAQALKQARIIGETQPLAEAWRTMGMVLAEMAPDRLPIQIEGRPYAPADCFNESFQLLRTSDSGNLRSTRGLALTLWAWAAYEMVQGNSDRGAAMQAQAEAIANKFGLALR